MRRRKCRCREVDVGSMSGVDVVEENRNKNKMKRKKLIVEEQEAWVSKTLSSVLKRAIYIAFKAGIACFSKIFWEPGFTRFVTSTLFNQANFAHLLQA